MSDLIRIRYNTKAEETADGQWKWRVVLEGSDGFEEVLVKSLILNVPSFSREDDMPVVGRKYHIACFGRLRVEDGVGIIDSGKLGQSKNRVRTKLAAAQVRDSAIAARSSVRARVHWGRKNTRRGRRPNR